MERPTGHIMRSGRDLLPSDDILSVTAWMFGVFGSQLTIGNTSFNKLLSVCRNPLNVLKASGQRIFVRTDRGYELLGVPSAFEMGPNSARWIYHDDRRTARRSGVTTSLDAPGLSAERRGRAGRTARAPRQPQRRRWARTSTTPPGRVLGGRRPTRASSCGPRPRRSWAQRYPEATFSIVSPDAGADRGDRRRRAAPCRRRPTAEAPYVVVRTKPVTRFSLVLTGSVLERAAGRGAGDRSAAAGRIPATRIRDGGRASGGASGPGSGGGRRSAAPPGAARTTSPA